MSAPSREEIERLARSTNYAIIGDAGIHLRLGQRKGTLEVLANEPIEGISVLRPDEIGPLQRYYKSIIDSAEAVQTEEYSLRIATVPYLIAESIARRKFPFALIELAKSGKIDKKTAEDVRGLLKATGMREKWNEFLQLIYDFAPNILP